MEQGKLLALRHKVNSRGQLHAIRGGIGLILGGLLFATSLAAWAETYRWRDDDGQTVYSQIPPQDGRSYSRIGAPPPPPDAAGARKQLDTLRQEQADRRKERSQDRDKQQQATEQQAAADRNCETARQNMRALEGNPHRLMRMPDGSSRRLTESERREKLAEAKKYLQENCR